jgi:hypothetical protein
MCFLLVGLGGYVYYENQQLLLLEAVMLPAFDELAKEGSTVTSNPNWPAERDLLCLWQGITCQSPTSFTT